ncbi:MAG TPA: glycosyltransferase [Streptosporangiaceae bacterium]|nr:glycosyltransferase [Streptosporangiaceae bacterium]
MSLAAAACVLAVIAWAYLLAGHGGYWRTDQRLPAARADPAAWPRVVAVVPARNEAAVLPATLPTLLAQEYPGAFEVVLVDDESSDQTADVATLIGREAARGGLVGSAADGARLRVVPGRRPPPGWAGKVWAMDQGVRAVGDAAYVLFTDADIAYRPGTLAALVRAAEADDRALVSQMALLRADTRWERLLVPAFVYFFAQLYPFGRVNRPGGRTAAAAGGCMLVRRGALEAAGGLERIRGARIDDVALGRLLKRAAAPARCWLGLSTDVMSIRPYPDLSELWNMIARSAYTQLRYSPVVLTATVVGLLWLYALPPAAALGGLAWLAAGGGATAAWLAGAGLAGWAVMTVSYLPMVRLYRLSPARAPSLPVIAMMYAAMTADSARRYYAGRGGQWKGRTIPAGRTRG